MSRLEHKKHVLDLALPPLADDGYTIFRNPKMPHLPKFMGGYRPDAIAMGKPKNIAIEVVIAGSPSPGAEPDRDVAARFAGQPDWERRLYYYNPGSDDIALAPVSRERVEDGIARTEALLAAGLCEAALLIGWSTLEALGRFLLPDRLKRPVAPGRLLELLANQGVVTPDEAERLRRLRPIRDRVAHGDLDAALDPGQVADLVATLRLALEEAETDISAA